MLGLPLKNTSALKFQSSTLCQITGILAHTACDRNNYKQVIRHLQSGMDTNTKWQEWQILLLLMTIVHVVHIPAFICDIICFVNLTENFDILNLLNKLLIDNLSRITHKNIHKFIYTNFVFPKKYLSKPNYRKRIEC